MAENNSLVTETTEREVVFTRIINAPRALVFKAWTDPAHLAQWWGPHGFTNPVCETDVRTDGSYRIVMRSPDGVEYPLKGVYLEVVEPERIVCTDNWEEHPAEWQDLLNENRPKGEGEPAKELTWTVTFEEHEGKMKLTIRTLFASVGDRDAMLKMGMTEGWGQSLERLDAHVAKKMRDTS